MFFFIFNSYGQQEEVLLKGQIIEFDNPITDAHLYNTNTIQGTSSTNDGNFSIHVRLNDTLIISHVNYFTLKITIDQKFLNQYPLIIYMKEKTNQLDTVMIPNHDLTKNLKKDSNSRSRTANRDSIIADFQRLAKLPTMKVYKNTEAPPTVNVDPTPGAIGGPITGGVGVGVLILIRDKDAELRREHKTKRNFPKRLLQILESPILQKP